MSTGRNTSEAVALSLLLVPIFKKDTADFSGSLTFISFLYLDCKWRDITRVATSLDFWRIFKLKKENIPKNTSKPN